MQTRNTHFMLLAPVVFGAFCGFLVTQTADAQGTCINQVNGQWTQVNLCSEQGTSYAPYYLEWGPDGNLWFADDRIDRMSPQDVLTRFQKITQGSYFTVARGSDGNVWMAPGDYDCAVWKITPQGVATRYSTLPACTLAITAGPDGNVWFAGYDTGSHQYVGLLGRVTPGGLITTFDVPLLPGRSDYSRPYRLSAGPDGNVWFTDDGMDSIGRFNPVTQKFLTPILLSKNILNPLSPDAITAGSDGNMWFTAINTIGFGVGRVTASGVVTKFDGGQAFGIDSAPDGTLWYSKNGKQLGHIDPRSAKVLPAAVPPSNLYQDAAFSGPVQNLSVGADGRVWFVSGISHWIGIYVP